MGGFDSYDASHDDIELEEIWQNIFFNIINSNIIEDLQDDLPSPEKYIAKDVRVIPLILQHALSEIEAKFLHIKHDNETLEKFNAVADIDESEQIQHNKIQLKKLASQIKYFKNIYKHINKYILDYTATNRGFDINKDIKFLSEIRSRIRNSEHENDINDYSSIDLVVSKFLSRMHSKLSQLQKMGEFTYLHKDLDLGAKRRTDSLALLLYLTNLRSTHNKGSFNCQIIDISDLDTLLKAPEHTTNQRCQLMVAIGKHYTAVELKIKEGKKLAIVMDAAGDTKKVNLIIKYLIENQYQCGVAQGQIQKDLENCAFFSFDMLLNSSQDANLFESIFKSHPTQYNAMDTSFEIPWSEMPAGVLRNIQSYSYLETLIDEARKNSGRELNKEPINFDDDDFQSMATCISFELFIQNNKVADPELDTKEKSEAINRFRLRQKILTQLVIDLLRKEELVSILSKAYGKIGSKTESNLVELQIQFSKKNNMLRELIDNFNKTLTESQQENPEQPPPSRLPRPRLYQ